jgi:catechol 2,3-dioxygenase-like lactoylglutathione lyase family enzyme
MFFSAIDRVLLPVAELSTAPAPFARLGLYMGAAVPHRSYDAHGLSWSVGEGANRFGVELVSPAEGPLEGTTLADELRRAVDAKRGLFAVVLRVPDLGPVQAELAAKGLLRTSEEVGGGELYWLPVEDRAGVNLALMQAPALAAAGHGKNAFPLKRLDHLAAVAPDLDEKTRFWTDVLGVPLAGEVTTPTMVIRQFRIGDAVLELLAPASADSPLRQRPKGPVSLASVEVTDLAAAVRQAREAGFTVADPAPGPLPGTHIATVPPAELSGLALQLLQYV